MFRFLDHHQGATLFLANVILKTFILCKYICWLIIKVLYHNLKARSFKLLCEQFDTVYHLFTLN